VAEKLTDGIEIIPFVQKVSGKAMAQGVWAALFGYTGFFFAASKAYHTDVVVICFSRFCPGKSH
jgi:hypothetical protein